mmetsp:Transcript_66406/g.176859  ORF Transcript_66406/g.176859 Transcript_66406/m.176859 type:complete len:231 (-) Transcript_66406:63-755(-)
MCGARLVEGHELQDGKPKRDEEVVHEQQAPPMAWPAMNFLQQKFHDKAAEAVKYEDSCEDRDGRADDAPAEPPNVVVMPVDEVKQHHDHSHASEQQPAAPDIDGAEVLALRLQLALLRGLRGIRLQRALQLAALQLVQPHNCRRPPLTCCRTSMRRQKKLLQGGLPASQVGDLHPQPMKLRPKLLRSGRITPSICKQQRRGKRHNEDRTALRPSSQAMYSHSFCPREVFL